jgi:hypothetical protein
MFVAARASVAARVVKPVAAVVAQLLPAVQPLAAAVVVAPVPVAPVPVARAVKCQPYSARPSDFLLVLCFVGERPSRDSSR